MLVKESYLRKIIKESLLLEAVYKQKQLKELSPELYDLIDNQFIIINNTFTLENDKSPGRFFIDILYQCMKELLNKFDPVKESNNGNLLELVENICIQLILLYQYKETTSSIVQSGETFRDYIYAFMLNPTKFIVKNLEDMPIDDMITKLKYVYTNVMNKARISGPERIMQFKNLIKRKDTYYPFGNELVDGKYLVVQPLSIMSSIFWARTNALGEEIVLPQQDDIEWCTARFTGGNMFNTYFVAGGTNLFYFLPEADMSGTKKLCIGITKIKKDNKEILTIGGTTSVDFKNTPFINEKQPIDVKLLKRLSNKTKISVETLNKLVEEMASKEPMDNYKYVSMLDLEQFAAATNIDTLAPANKNGKRNEEELLDISSQINSTLKTYKDPEYTARGYKSDPKILKYIEKNWIYWISEGVNLDSNYMPDSVKEEKKDIEKMKNLISKNNLLINFADDSIIKELIHFLPLDNPDFIIGNIDRFKDSVRQNIPQYVFDNEYITQSIIKKSKFNYRYLSEKSRADKNTVKYFIDNVRNSIGTPIDGDYSIFGSLWSYIPDITGFFKNNPDILKYYLEYTEGAGVYFFPPVLKYDRNFMHQCIMKYPEQGLNIPLIFESYVDKDNLEERISLINDKDFWINLIEDITSKKTNITNVAINNFFKYSTNFVTHSSFSKEKYHNFFNIILEAYHICKEKGVVIDSSFIRRIESLKNEIQAESRKTRKLIMTESTLKMILRKYL